MTSSPVDQSVRPSIRLIFFILGLSPISRTRSEGLHTHMAQVLNQTGKVGR